MDEENQRALLNNESVTKGPSVRIIEDGMKGFLRESLNGTEKGYVSLKKDDDLKILKLEIGKLEEGQKTEARQIVTLGAAVLAFSCDSQRVLIDEDKKINMYFWNIKKIEDGGLALEGVGEMKLTISLNSCRYEGKDKKANCDLKVVTKTKW